LKIIPILFSPFKADGGSMFGITPKKSWENYYPSDENNLCKWALHSLLIDDGKNIVLIDNGFGNSDQQILKDYKVENFKQAKDIIAGYNYTIEQVTHVILTHLHIDHCGGSFLQNFSNNLEPTFPNAKYIISKNQFDTAGNPSEFEKDSFQPVVISAFSKMKNIQFVEKNGYLFYWLELRIFDGHTNGLIIPIIHTSKTSIVFTGDLIPSLAHLVLQSIMAYDIDPVLSLSERNQFLNEACEKKYILFFQHDFYHVCCNLKKENSRIVPAEIFQFSGIIY